MTDLTFCYLHMTKNELQTLDTLGTKEYMGELSDDDIDIPEHMIPPNPDESDTAHDYLPSQVHPSYPYGNPTNVKHPAAKPRPPYDPTSRALFEDMGHSGGGINAALRWQELALDELLPVDEEKEEQRRAMKARKMASGSSNNHPQQQQQQNPPQPQQLNGMVEEESDESDGFLEEEEEDEDEDEEDGDEEAEDTDEEEE